MNLASKFGLFVFIFICVVQVSSAQDLWKGKVLEAKTTVVIPHAFIKNMKSGSVVVADEKGYFRIKVKDGDLLVFSSPGYVSDTLVYTIRTNERRYLEPTSIRLNEVVVIAEDFDPRIEYPEAYEHGEFLKSPLNGGLNLSISRLFGTKGRQARGFRRMIERETIERKIDYLFSKQRITSLIPLKGRELENFMSMYRPSLMFLQQVSSQGFTLYLNECYKKFIKLPPEQRTPANPFQMRD